MLPTAVAVRTPTPTPGASDVEMSPLAQRLGEETFDYLTMLTESMSPRQSATDQELDAAEFLASEYEKLGYDVSIQPFPVRLVPSESEVVSILSPDPEGISGSPLGMSGLGTATGEVVFVGLAGEGDMPEEGLEGKVALIQRGTITFQEKVDRVTSAGAVAAVVFNNQSGPFNGTLSAQSTIPAVSISQESGQAVQELLASGMVEATVSVEIQTIESRNVIAEKRGTADDGGVVVLGGHYDTVPNVPGANDNGSGTATLITVARETANTSYPFTVRFIAFGSEEVGLLGSQFYVSDIGPEGIENTLAMVNFDALASGDEIGIMGTDDSVPGLLQFAEDNGIKAGRRFFLTGGSSDHAPFRAAEIPFIFFLADDFSRIHSPADTLEFVQPELMGGSAAIAITALEILAGR
jgi:aminopeptidase YwaD